MAEKEYVTYGKKSGCGCGCGMTGASQEITGCRFSLAPMTDRFVEVILGAIEKVDTSKVWKATDKLSTVYRGKQIHVEDALKATFVQAYQDGVHMTMEATFSKGCPGDTDADFILKEDDIPVNEAAIKDIHFPVACKIALYPMGIENYMEHIATVVNHAIDMGIYEGSSHYCTILNCDVQKLFEYFHDVNTYCGKELSHYIFEITCSVNSPTAE
ncbi:MAG: YkoF family thiamine/hydroxymethylpyrimidine-binding protein [Hespellia sp.]|nr:YkoF family thiamine/hydroxymethylpyrimidine-binding protein [Hespellia sp.]